MAHSTSADPRLALVRRERELPLAVLPGVGGSILISIALFLAEMPLTSMAVIAASALVMLFGKTPIASHTGLISVEAIRSHAAREAYRAVVFGLCEVQRVAHRAAHLGAAIVSAVQRCNEAAELAGRLALTCDPLQDYLDGHDLAQLQSEIERLRDRAEHERDDLAVTTLGNAIGARLQQLRLRDSILARRNRLIARLELVRATFATISAGIVDLQVMQDEELTEAGSTGLEPLASTAEELATLRSALLSDLAIAG